MAYTIYHSNSLQEFVGKHSNLFHSNSLFGDRVITVVQNKNIASWLKLELTKVDGISMDLMFEYPENAVKQLVLGFKSGKSLFGSEEESKSLLFMDSLKIVVYKTLEEELRSREKFPMLFDYVQGSSSRLFQLSDSIAGLFYHYGMNCPQMVSAWDRKELYRNDSGEILRVEDQKWQMRLWNILFNNMTPYLHISKVLNHVLNSGEGYDPELSPFGKCRIVLFGSTFLGESAIKFFNYLSKDIDVHHFILTPSEIYTKEVSEEPLSLLNRFSGLINGFTSISREKDFLKKREVLFSHNSGNSLLKEIQIRTWNNTLSEGFNKASLSFSPNDGSVKICKVTGGWREVEILKDKILDVLDNNPGLKLTDIGVVAPEIDSYASYIEGVFSDTNTREDKTVSYGKTHIPYNIIGLKGGEDSPYIRGILSLLELPGSDFNRKDIFNILSNPCFMERFHISHGERDLFLKTVDNLNIKWGIDKDHRAKLGYKGDSFNTWEEGFRRFLLGISLNQEDHSLIPYNLSDSQTIDSIGTLVHIVRSLYCDLWGLNRLALKIDEWVFLIETIMESYLKPVKGDTFDERERLSVKNQYRNILNLLDDLNDLNNFDSQTLPFSVIKSLLKEFIVKASSTRGRYLTHGVTFSSLKPLRAVPFKHIFVLGLNEENFPGKERIPSYDLRSIYDQKIDLSKRQNDKFAFLELLLSAKESITLFYSGKNQVTGDELQPSVVINELLEAIDSNFGDDYGRNSIVEEHPLQNFDNKYFSKSSNLKSYNERAYISAKAYLEDKSFYSGLDLIDDNITDCTIEVSVKDLVSFVKNPVKSFFTKGEGIFLNSEDELVDDIYENRDLKFLTKWKLVNLAVQMGLKDDLPLNPIVDSFFKIAKLEGVYKDSPLTHNIREEIEELIGSVDKFLIKKELKGTNYMLETRELDGEYSSLEFDIDSKKVVLTGELENIWTLDRECFTAGITLGSNKDMKVKDKIAPYIYSLIMFSHPGMKEEKLLAYSIGREDILPAEFVTSTEATEDLKSLLKLYIKNQKRPLPLFPEIMDSPNIEDVIKSWENSIDNTMFYSPIRECPYVQMAFSCTPEFHEDDIQLMYNAIYKKLVDKKAEVK